MKTLIKRRGITLALMLVITLFVTCSDPAEDDVNPKEEEPEEITPGQADALAGALSFTSGATKKSGSPPTVSNTTLTRMNGSDTVYVAEGIKQPLRISYPAETPATGMYVLVPSSTFYYDVPVKPEDGSDSTGTVYLQVDADNELPTDIPITITPHDDSGAPIDMIERILEVEKAKEPDCPITETGWYWTSTTAFDHLGNVTFENFPGKRFKTKTQYEGCCDPNTGQNCIVLATNLNAEVIAEILYIIMSETFSFNENGTFVRNTFERKRNFNPVTTQWCSSNPGYNEDDSHVTYTGTHDFTPGASQLNFLSSTASCDLCGYGSPGGGLIYTCHTMIIIKGSPAEGSLQVRVYKSRFTDQWSD